MPDPMFAIVDQLATYQIMWHGDKQLVVLFLNTTNGKKLNVAFPSGYAQKLGQELINTPPKKN